MSSYLTFYLVPKKEISEKQEPLKLLSVSRNSDIYRAYYENTSIAYIDSENQYTELTKEISNHVLNALKSELIDAKKKSELKIKALQALPKLEGESLKDYLYETTEYVEYLKELESTLNYVDFISYIVEDISSGYTDFEKVLINID